MSAPKEKAVIAQVVDGVKKLPSARADQTVAVHLGFQGRIFVTPRQDGFEIVVGTKGCMGSSVILNREEMDLVAAVLRGEHIVESDVEQNEMLLVPMMDGQMKRVRAIYITSSRDVVIIQEDSLHTDTISMEAAIEGRRLREAEDTARRNGAQ